MPLIATKNPKVKDQKCRTVFCHSKFTYEHFSLLEEQEQVFQGNASAVKTLFCVSKELQKTCIMNKRQKILHSKNCGMKEEKQDRIPFWICSSSFHKKIGEE